MRKLLSANIRRLFKTKMFWLEILSLAVLSVWIVFANYNEAIQLTEYRRSLEDVFFILYQIIILFPAVGVSVELGTEYTDGALRNKLIVGHTRREAYFSFLITHILSATVLVLMHGILSYAIGYPLFGNFTTPASQLIWVLLSLLLDMIVFTAFFTAITINCSSKAFAIVSSLLSSYFILLATSFIQNKLTASEMIYDSLSVDTEGMVHYGNLIPNPSYTTGTERTVYEFLYNLLPTGHCLQVQEQSFSNAPYWLLASIALSIVITMLGYYFFKKKNIN